MTDTTNQPASYEIAPEDEHIAQEIRSADPVLGGPPATKVNGYLKLPEEIAVTTFAPEIRAAIRARVSAVPESQRPALERELAHAALYRGVADARILGGPGPDAGAYSRELFNIAHQEDQIMKRQQGIAAELARDKGTRREIDPATGQEVMVPHYVVTGSARVQLETQLAEFGRQLRALDIEKHRRLKVALYEEVEQRKAMQARLGEFADAKAKAESDNRAARVEALAAGYRKTGTHSL